MAYDAGMCHTKAGPPIPYTQGPVLYAVMFLVGRVNGTACLILSTLLAIYFSLSPRLSERGQGSEEMGSGNRKDIVLTLIIRNRASEVLSCP